MARVINISEKTKRWEDSPVMQKLAALDAKRCKKTIERYKKNLAKKKIS